MIITDYALEKELVNEFIEYTFHHPLETNGEKRNIFIWGHEILLQDGKGEHNSGKLDLLGTDDTGEVWLIEAKLNSNKEWTSEIWNKQIGMYAKSLQKRTEQEIVLGAKRYIRKESIGVPFSPFIPDDIESLADAFCQWALQIRKNNDDGKLLYETTLRKIKNGELIHCVLSNEVGVEIWRNRPEDDLIVRSYITFDRVHADILLERNKIVYSNTGEVEYSRGTFQSYTQERNSIEPTTDKIPLLLEKNVIPIYEKIISFLLDLGWDGKYVPNTKGFRFDMNTVYGVPLRIHLGWIDADGQQHVEFRKAYSFGLKFNIDFRFFKRHKEMEKWKIGYSLGQELAQKANYHNRGNEFSILDSKWTAEKTKGLKWDGEMIRYIDQRNRDYIGLIEEQNDLEEVFVFLKKVIN